MCARLDPVEAVTRRLPDLEPFPELARDLQERAKAEMRKNRWANKVRWSELLAWLHGEEGVTFSAWLCLRGANPGRWDTLEEVADLFNRSLPEQVAEFVRRRNKVTGLDAAAAADWKEPDREDVEREAGRGRPTPWKRVLRWVLEAYPGTSFADLRGWTLYQLRLARAESDELGGTSTMTASTPGEAFLLRQQLRGLAGRGNGAGVRG